MRFNDVLGAVWPAGHPQIYGELRKLHDQGLIAIDGQGPRRRTAYRVTELGLAEVRHWLTDTPVDHTLRLEPVLRSVFFWLFTPEQLTSHLQDEAAYYQTLADTYRKLAAAKDRGDYGDSPQTGSLRIAAEAGIRLNDALQKWAEWANEY